MISTPRVLAISAPSGLAAMAVSQSADESVRLAMPENIRKRAKPLPVRRAGRRARGLGHRERQRIQHAGAGRVARERRSDHGVDA